MKMRSSSTSFISFLQIGQVDEPKISASVQRLHEDYDSHKNEKLNNHFSLLRFSFNAFGKMGLVYSIRHNLPPSPPSLSRVSVASATNLHHVPSSEIPQEHDST